MLNFDHVTKWYIYKLESVQENETQKDYLRNRDKNRRPNPSQKVRLGFNENK